MEVVDYLPRPHRFGDAEGCILAVGVVAWIESRVSFPMPQMDCAAMLRRRTESGRPASSIPLRTATPTAASAFWPEKLRARKREPMMALYRPIAAASGQDKKGPLFRVTGKTTRQKARRRAFSGCHVR